MNALSRGRIPNMLMVFLGVISVFSVFTRGQQPSSGQPAGGGMQFGDWLGVIGLAVGLVGVGFGIYQYKKRKRDQIDHIRIQHAVDKKIKKKEEVEKALSAEDQYRAALRKELGQLRMVGPEFESHSLALEESYVSLRLSPSRQCEEPFGRERKTRFPMALSEADSHLSPPEVMKKAFPAHQTLLVVGEPGSGKTTLLKFYALTCLDNKQHSLGFGNKKILPLFFPLRELLFSDTAPKSLSENLAAWAKKRSLEIPVSRFSHWLHNTPTLVLLDGLDEISDLDRRKQVCQWLETALIGLKNARLVLTTRPTGYRKLEGLELECPHLRADILDFSDRQQEQFINKWYRAVYLHELPEGAAETAKKLREKEALDKAQAIIAFLNRKENKSIRELARVPMLLQIMAIIWKDRDYLPGSRAALYDISLNYLLDYRDRRRNLKPLLPAEKARIVLSRLALWLLEILRSDNAPQEEIHQLMQPILREMENRPEAGAFCRNLRDRAGLIADYGSGHYIFRHKSFLEFLAAQQMFIECRENQDRINLFIDSFNDPWWEEALRFFIGKSDDLLFDRFMDRLFQAEISRQMDDHRQTLLQHLVSEAPQKKMTALVEGLSSKNLNNNQKRYVLDCLKTIGTPEAVQAVQGFIENSGKDEVNLEHARDIAAGLVAPREIKIEAAVAVDIVKTLPDSFRNPFEDHVEYIKILGGTFTYSVEGEKGAGKKVTVPDLYFCKYPVTNKRYRRFVSFLAGKEKELVKELPLEMYGEKLLELSKSLEGYKEYLGHEPRKWQDQLRSRLDDDKRFNGEEQPVVGVTWYAARAYCFWLSCLDSITNRGEKIKDVEAMSKIYRLPTEMEWEWAAGGVGEPDGAIREYPWPKDKGEPNPNLANYGQNVGTTTPVGRYPEGATPQGLMDMAGNVWEWMENLYKEKEVYRALRGGSWYTEAQRLRCRARDGLIPVDRGYLWGFRVLRSQSL